MFGFKNDNREFARTLARSNENQDFIKKKKKAGMGRRSRISHCDEDVVVVPGLVHLSALTRVVETDCCREDRNRMS